MKCALVIVVSAFLVAVQAKPFGFGAITDIAKTGVGAATGFATGLSSGVGAGVGAGLAAATGLVTGVGAGLASGIGTGLGTASLVGGASPVISEGLSDGTNPVKDAVGPAKIVAVNPQGHAVGSQAHSSLQGYNGSGVNVSQSNQHY